MSNLYLANADGPAGTVARSQMLRWTEHAISAGDIHGDRHQLYEDFQGVAVDASLKRVGRAKSYVQIGTDGVPICTELMDQRPRMREEMQ